MASQLMGLSLFIMMLAFFIVLNAISSFNEAKVRPAVASVEGTFGSNLLGEDLMPSQAKSDSESDGEGDTLDYLESLFKSHMTGIKINKEKVWGTMHIELPMEKFEKAVMSLDEGELEKQGSAQKEKYFLSTLVSLMETGQQKLPYRMDMVLNVEKDPGFLHDKDPQKLRRISVKLSDIAFRLKKGGLPATQMSIGLQEGRKGIMDLYFRPYKSLNPVKKQ